MKDLLRMNFINSLPQPLMIRQWGRKTFDWPVELICCETGFLRIDVCGMLDNLHISDVAQFEDGDGNVYDAEVFYSDYEEDQ